MSRPTVIACMFSSSDSWELQQHPRLWHSRAGGGAVHSIRSRHGHGLLNHLIGAGKAISVVCLLAGWRRAQQVPVTRIAPQHQLISFVVERLRVPWRSEPAGVARTFIIAIAIDHGATGSQEAAGGASPSSRNAVGHQRCVRCIECVAMSALPPKRTLTECIAMSVMCQKRTLTRLTKSMKGGSSSARLSWACDNIS